MAGYSPPPGGGSTPVTDFPGPVAVSVSDILPMPRSGSFVEVLCGQVVAGTPTIGVNLNGVQVTTFTLTAVSMSDVTLSAPITVAKGDRLQFAIITPGGASGVTCLPLVH